MGIKESFIRAGLIAGGAVSYGLAFPPMEFSSLAWIAPIFWLFAIEKIESPRQRFWVMFAVGYCGSLMVIYWLINLFSALTIALWAVPAIYFGTWGVLASLFRRSSTWLNITWPAICWVAIEYIRCELAPLAFSFGSLGSSQANLLGFSIASVVGIYGVSGIMVMLASIVVRAWKIKFTGRWLAFPTLGIFMSCAFIPATIPSSNKEILGTALLQQLDQHDDIAAWETMPDRSSEKPDLIVWPELSIADDPARYQASWFIDMMRQDASQAKWGVIFGGVRFPEGSRDVNDPFYNTAYFMDSPGSIVASAGKNQPVQLMNDGIPAEDISVIRVGNSLDQQPLKMGLGVCYDGCFQKYSRQMVDRGADFLVFPTMNVELWGRIQHRQHQRLFQFRAAETGRTVLVAAVSGPTFAAQPGGASTHPAPFHQTAAVQTQILSPHQTLFNLGGWLTGPVCLVAFIFGLTWKAADRYRGAIKSRLP